MLWAAYKIADGPIFTGPSTFRFLQKWKYLILLFALKHEYM